MENQQTPTIYPIPSRGQAFRALFRADVICQWRQRKAFLMSLLVPVVFIVSWSSLIADIGAAGVLAISVAVGLPAVGLMGYSQTVARDRERGVFQRLRAAPISTSSIMASRILVQVIVIGLIALITYIVGAAVDGIRFPFLNIVLMLVAAMAGGLAFLGLGQFIVGLIKSSEGVNAAARLIYFPLAIVGAVGQVGLFGTTVQQIVTYSPLGTTNTILSGALTGTFDHAFLIAFLITVGYGVFFAFIGIRKFTWAVN